MLVWGSQKPEKKWLLIKKNFVSSFFYICVITETILYGANLNRSGAFSICTMWSNKWARPCIIRPIWMCVAVRVERKDTLVLHMFIYNTAFSLNEQIKKKIFQADCIHHLYVHITQVSLISYTNPLTLLPFFFFLLILTAVIANVRQIFGALASLVFRSDVQSAPIYILQWLMPSSLCQGRQKKKSTLRRLTGTDNLFTPTDKTWPDCYLFVRDGKILTHNS